MPPGPADDSDAFETEQRTAMLFKIARRAVPRSSETGMAPLASQGSKALCGTPHTRWYSTAVCGTPYLTADHQHPPPPHPPARISSCVATLQHLATFIVTCCTWSQHGALLQRITSTSSAELVAVFDVSAAFVASVQARRSHWPGGLHVCQLVDGRVCTNDDCSAKSVRCQCY